MIVTLANLKEATKQQIFDQVAAHMLTQNKASMKVEGSDEFCAYRGDAGLKCAAGCLIADDEYKPEMDRSVFGNGTGWDTLVSRGLAPSEHEMFIGRLQRIHDSTPPTNWKDRLNEFAVSHDLIPVE